jgi:hypothetical protein
VVGFDGGGFCGGLKGCGDGSGAEGTLELTLHRPEFCRGIIIKLSFDTPPNTKNNREYPPSVMVPESAASMLNPSPEGAENLGGIDAREVSAGFPAVEDPDALAG